MIKEGTKMLKGLLRAAVLMFISIFLFSNMLFAGQWQKTHPRRAEVNKRLNNQNRRINKEVQEGKITKEQAKELHQNDREMRKEERNMAKHHGGHITKEEQRELNKEEDINSKSIGK